MSQNLRWKRIDWQLATICKLSVQEEPTAAQAEGEDTMKNLRTTFAGIFGESRLKWITNQSRPKYLQTKSPAGYLTQPKKSLNLFQIRSNINSSTLYLGIILLHHCFLHFYHLLLIFMSVNKQFLG